MGFPQATWYSEAGGDASDDIERLEKLPTNREGKDLYWSDRLRRWIDRNTESDECVFCGAPIDPEEAYHNTICRRCA